MISESLILNEAACHGVTGKSNKGTEFCSEQNAFLTRIIYFNKLLRQLSNLGAGVEVKFNYS